jgi:hypothetical protein
MTICTLSECGSGRGESFQRSPALSTSYLRYSTHLSLPFTSRTYGWIKMSGWNGGQGAQGRGGRGGRGGGSGGCGFQANPAAANRRVYVGNLKFEVSWQDLKDLMNRSVLTITLLPSPLSSSSSPYHHSHPPITSPYHPHPSAWAPWCAQTS